MDKLEQMETGFSNLASNSKDL